MALLGAGISAASGLPTFRGAGGFWRTYDAVDLATPEAFESHPDLVWQFYGFRRHMALKAQPNAAHYALAELAKRNKEFITLTQNVDGAVWIFSVLLDPHIRQLADYVCSGFLQVFPNVPTTLQDSCNFCTALFSQ